MKRTFVGAIAFLLLNISLPLHAQDVQVSDITDGKIALIGLLGKPLGTVVTLEGQLVSDPKAANGRITAALSQGTPPLQAHQLVKFSGYEGAAYIGTPDGARAAMSSDASPLDWKLQSLVHVIKLL